MSRFVEPTRDLELQGHYAGMVSRFCAYLIDITLSGLLFGALMWLVLTALGVVTGHSWQASDHGVIVTTIYVAWLFTYFALPLAMTGRTAGKGILGLRVVRADGVDLDPARAAVRTLVYPLSFLLFGLGLLLGLVQRERRCLHDLLAGTAVVYAWDARTARLRLLTRAATDSTGD